MAQISGYLGTDECDSFASYASCFGLDNSALAKLLLARELRLKRLPSLSERFFDCKTSSMEKRKITAHFSDKALKDKFDAHAAKHDLKPARASAIVYRAELEERWLEGAVNQFDSN